MKNFFISYNSHDRAWAEWIAWELEANGYSVIIQAWDFVGNWIIKMDEAMRDAERTIVILSPHYVRALYTQSEWANAFRLDPAGKKDLLIPLRIEFVELEGILTQIVYVDFVDRNEEEVHDLLLKRVKGERGKPATKSRFPGDQPSNERRREQALSQKPVFPAAQKDEERLRRVRDIVVRWRGQFVNEVESLTNASKRARQWMENPPTQFDDDVGEVITLAATAARAFQSISRDDLEYATSYGLAIHPTIYWGSAVSHSVSMEEISSFARANYERVDEEQKKRGLGVAHEFIPDSYGFEMLARVLEAALVLARFNIGGLPRGYLTEVGQSVPNDLNEYGSLFLARVDENPGLQVFAFDLGHNPIGTLVARNLALHALCSQVNDEGYLEVVAHDAQHLYCWRMSSKLPTVEFPKRELIHDACFVTSASSATVVAIGAKGTIYNITCEDKFETHQVALKGRELEDARIWVDPIEKGAWYLIVLTRNHHIMSGLSGLFSTDRSSKEMWNDPVFLTEFDGIVNWKGAGSLTLGVLDNLPCLIVRRHANWGSGVCFLDPKTLVPIHRPLILREFTEYMCIASGRWLVVGLLQQGQEGLNRISVWDLAADKDQHVGSWFVERGDVYNPTVIAETDSSFQTMQVFRSFDLSVSKKCEVVRFHWPLGNVERVMRFRDIRIWPIRSASKP